MLVNTPITALPQFIERVAKANYPQVLTTVTNAINCLRPGCEELTKVQQHLSNAVGVRHADFQKNIIYFRYLNCQSIRVRHG